MTLWINQDGGGRVASPSVVGLCHGGVHSAPCIGPLPEAGQASGSPSGTDSISTYSFRTNGLSKLEVRLRKLIGSISEPTNKGVFRSTAWSSELSDGHSVGSVMGGHLVLPVLGEGYRQGLHSMYCPQQPLTDFTMCTIGRVTIGMLPDYALLEIFHFYKDDKDFSNRDTFTEVWKWEMLTQVCRQWRRVVFGSPRRLDLRVACTSTTPNARLLDVWPPFPVIVLQSSQSPVVDENGVENLIAALECRDRISEIGLFDVSGPVIEKLVTVLHESLPVLTDFSLTSADESVPVLPETFLGGFAPRLRSFELTGIPFPSFPKFILRLTHIVLLFLDEIPSSGYISPEVMATCLATLPNLGVLFIGFRSPSSRPLQLSPPNLTRAALPALYDLDFSGVSEYFEDFVARINTPRLTRLNIVFFMDLIFNIPQLRNFIDRTGGIKPFDEAAIEFSGRAIRIVFGPPPLPPEGPHSFQLEIRCERPDWQLSSIVQIFSQQLPLLSHVEQLRISEFPWESFEWKDDPDSSQWLELFRLLIAAQSLHVSKALVSPVTGALRDLTEQMAIQVLPVLQTLSLEGLEPSGPVHEAIKSFATARQLSHQPVVIQ